MKKQTLLKVPSEVSFSKHGKV